MGSTFDRDVNFIRKENRYTWCMKGQFRKRDL